MSDEEKVERVIFIAETSKYFDANKDWESVDIVRRLLLERNISKKYEE